MGKTETILASCEKDAQLARAETISQDNTEPLTVATLLAHVKHSTALIEQLLEEHPELASMNLRDVRKEVQSNSVMKAIRQSVWSIFARAGWVLGRNNPDAVVEDVVEMFKSEGGVWNTATLATSRGRYASNPFDWVNQEVVPVLLDLDMVEFVAPRKTSTGNKWYVPKVKPYLVISKKLYDRINTRSSRAN